VILAELLLTISEETDMQILLCTHSEHIVETLYGQANFIWMKDGLVQNQGPTIEKLPILLDIGALDDFEKLKNGEIKAVVLTEDRNTRYLEKLLSSNGFDLASILIYSYKTSSNLEGASLFVEFIKEVARECKVIVHRDSDFMTEAEIEQLKNKIQDSNAIPFITSGSDIESYFIDSLHISTLLEVDVQEVIEWINDLATKHHTEIQHQFTRKRDDIKSKLYRQNPASCPDTLSLLGTAIPLDETKRKGKFMFKKIRGDMYRKFGRVVDVAQITDFLLCDELKIILLQIS